MDKTTDIDTTLCKMVEQIKNHDEEMVNSIKDQLKKHEEDVKKKLDGYIIITKNGLSSIKTKMEDLENKIMNYIVLGGKFQSLGTQLRSYYNNVDYAYINRKKYIRIGRSISKEQDEDVKNKIKKLEEHRNEYGKLINNPQRELMKLYTRLCCEGNVRYVTEDFENHKGNYPQLLSQIPKFVNRLKPFENFGNKIKREGEPMKELIEITTSIESAKSVVECNKKHLDPILPYHLRDTLAIKTQELDGLIRDITILRTRISTSIKHLNNTKLLIEYLNEFEKQKKTFEAIKISGSRLRVIGKLIRSMRKFRKGYKDLVWSIFRSSDKLFSKFEKGDNKTTHSIGQRLQHLPTTIPFGKRPLKEISAQIKKLRAIQSFSPRLNGYSIRSLHFIEEPQVADISCLLKDLKEIDTTLTNSSYMKWYAIKISGSYEENKREINGGGTKNGNGIEEHVRKIKEIPDKIAELHSKVKYYIVVLNIAKSVNETLEGVKEKARELKKIGENLRDSEHYIGFMIKRYGHIHSNIVALSDDVSKLNDLKRFKRTVESLNHIMRILNKNIKRMKKIKEWLKQSISEIIGYNKIMLGISLEIAKGFYNIGIDHFGMPLVLFPDTVLGSILHGIHGLMLPLVTRHLIFLSVQVGFIMAHLSWIRMKLEHIVGSEFIKEIEKKANGVDCSIKEVESSIESVIICFLKCSNKYITENTKELTKRMLVSGGHGYNNEMVKQLVRCLENIGCQYNI